MGSRGINLVLFRLKKSKLISFKMPTKRSPRGLKRKIKEEKENLDVHIKNEVSRFDSDDEELAEYEQKRLQNIADRKNKIDELKITDISLELASDLNQQQQNKSKSSYSKRGLSAIPKEKEILPPRKSGRDCMYSIILKWGQLFK